MRPLAGLVGCEGGWFSSSSSSSSSDESWFLRDFPRVDLPRVRVDAFAAVAFALSDVKEIID